MPIEVAFDDVVYTLLNFFYSAQPLGENIVYLYSIKKMNYINNES